MNLKTRPVAIAAGGVAGLAIVALGWQIARGPGPGAGSVGGLPASSSSASGVVTGVSGATAPAGIVTMASSGKVTPAPAPAASAAPLVPGAAKHPVLPGKAPAILPNEVDAALAQALGGRKQLGSYVYLEPLARRFVASVDGLGNKNAPTTLWLLRPAPKTLALKTDARQAEQHLIDSAANSRRYDKFVRWALALDTHRLLDLYARMYPLLQQSYVELGHPAGHFNDRLIEVIDQMLATPVQRAPLRLRPLAEAPAASGATPRTPRYEFADAELEALSTGQKMLLRVGPQHAARLKIKLKALRQGLLKLGRPS
ncbi:DUF3014 domain-containing protein [Roseateles violae]|uniref:DUF3014 domain-containing protein n=1 Tax=Roseateles violae TaxID=3058042 RepID=A0ABT8DT25_9BURK|nr:DUF3014 domain-containing protein [Pelomonas sp. PFR6]MDN3920160.1 DUF3014 domain-containing protein [Pelomonas sp. PFR6]